MASRASRLLRRRRRKPAPIETTDYGDDRPGLWLDGPDATGRLERVADIFLRQHLSALAGDGVTRIPGVVDPAICDAVRADFVQFCDEHPESKAFVDEHGNHSRLGNFHLASDAAMSIGLHPVVLRLLDAAFDRPAAVVSSLLFEKGTQQFIHRDMPFFHTNPEARFFGVWTALEDISTDAGPLEYYLGGHRVSVNRLDVAADLPDATVDERYAEYIRRVSAACDAAGLPRVAADDMRKGDVLVWHAQLPHGGSPIAERKLTRASIVFHYMPQGAPISGVDSFFSADFPPGRPPVRMAGGREVIAHDGVNFAADL